ncbi:F-box only protein 30-like isoform X2 [Rhopilema esculentum]|uniref:F-box only protein 30-like isoform X2 n=1 Tax=Rhopilema esculentum TaxID=499914 RepID=UPI0031D0397E
MEEGVLVYDYSDILHLHCQTCYQKLCPEQQNCTQARCLYCDIQMHSCKIDDHETICAMMPRPCPNAYYGCSSKVPTHEVAKHLDTCPANVVQCAMEWNRYPLYSRAIEHWIPFPEINPPKIKGQLDIEFALSDQRKLAMEKKKKMMIGRWKVSRRREVNKIDQGRIDQLASLFASKNNFVTNGPALVDSVLGSEQYREESSVANSNENANKEAGPEQNILDKPCSDDRTYTRETPVQVNLPSKVSLEKLKEEKEKYIEEKLNSTIKESKSDDLEFNGSWKSNHRRPIFEETDLVGKGSEKTLPEIDDNNEVELVFSVDVQSADFHSEKEAILICNAKSEVPNLPRRYLEHLENARTEGLGLNVVIETIPKFQSTYPMYSIPCQVSLRRDQYCSHFKNVHDDIHGGLNYWTQHRCPLAQYGCTYIRNRLRPGSKEASVVFDHDIDNFGIRPTKVLNCGKQETGNEFALLCLPVELIEKIAMYLDSFSINQFSKSCRTAREVCRSLLQQRGIVVFDWERGYYPDGSVTWRVRRKRWFFTPAFSKIDTWCFTDEPPIGEHLKKCQFYNKVLRKKVLKLPIADPGKIKLKSDWRVSPVDAED